MATGVEQQSQVVDLALNAFEAFCEDIGAMLSLDIEVEETSTFIDKVEKICKAYKKPAAVILVDAQGELDGTFRLILDKKGLFILGGTIVMQPEKKIEENLKRGSDKDIEAIVDGFGEMGNLMIGSWDRIFRDELSQPIHLKQSGTFIGDPRENTEQMLGVSGEHAFLFKEFEMTITPFASFKCGVLFPESLFEPKDETAVDQLQADVQEAQSNTADETSKNEKMPEIEETVSKDQNGQSPSQPSQTEDQVNASIDKTEAENNTGEKGSDGDHAQNSSAKKDTPSEQKLSGVSHGEQAEENADKTCGISNSPSCEVQKESSEMPPSVSNTVPEMNDSPEVVRPAQDSVLLSICAQDIMQQDVIWGHSDESVQDILTKMQQFDTGYVLIGTDGVLEGLVSRSDIASAQSIYLRPIFSKWRRPQDDATLQIKVKWIMTRPVRTLRPDASLAVMMEHMMRYAGKCIPIVETESRTIGIVTVFDIFEALLSHTIEISFAGKPALVQAAASCSNEK